MLGFESGGWVRQEGVREAGGNKKGLTPQVPCFLLMESRLEGKGTPAEVLWLGMVWRNFRGV